MDDESDYAMIKRIKMEPEAILSHEDDIMAQLQQESSDLEVEPNFSLGVTINGDEGNEGILMQHMDIREPLSRLRILLEERLGVELTDYCFWLQDTQMVKQFTLVMLDMYSLYVVTKVHMRGNKIIEPICFLCFSQSSL